MFFFQETVFDSLYIDKDSGKLLKYSQTIQYCFLMMYEVIRYILSLRDTTFKHQNHEHFLPWLGWTKNVTHCFPSIVEAQYKNKVLIFLEQVLPQPRQQSEHLATDRVWQHVNETICMYCKNIKNVSSFIAQYPVLRIVQSTLHFTSLTDLFTQTPSQLLWEASSYMRHLMCEGCSYTYPPLTVYSQVFIYTAEWTGAM